jgi:hypothetical protein
MDLLIWITIGSALYFLPSIIAMNRRHRNISAITTVNLVLGWTGIGWLWALIWSMTNNTGESDPTPHTHMKCPDCAELIKREALVCKHCGRKITPA